MGVLSETSSFDTNITVPIHGDNVDAQVLTNGALQKLTNRSRYLLNSIAGFIVGNGDGAIYTVTGASPITIGGNGLAIANNSTIFRAASNLVQIGITSTGADNGHTITTIGGATCTINADTSIYGYFSIGDSTSSSSPAGDCYRNFTFRKTTAFGTAAAPVTLNAWSTFTQTGNVNFAGGSGFTCDIAMSLLTHSDVTFGGSSKTFTCGIEMVVNRAATFTDNVTLGTSSSDVVTINGTTTVTAPMVMSGSGRIVGQNSSILGSADFSFTAAGPRTIVCTNPHSGVTATIDDTNMRDGDRIRLVVWSGGFAGDVSITLNSTGHVFKFITSLSLLGGYVEAERVAGVWTAIAYGRANAGSLTIDGSPA